MVGQKTYQINAVKTSSTTSLALIVYLMSGQTAKLELVFTACVCKSSDLYPVMGTINLSVVKR